MELYRIIDAAGVPPKSTWTALVKKPTPLMVTDVPIRASHDREHAHDDGQHRIFLLCPMAAAIRAVQFILSSILASAKDWAK